MFDALSTKSDAFTLHFAPTVRVAGGTLAGSVDLHFALAQEENIQQVRVKLRGSIVTRVTQSKGRETTTYKETIPLVRDERVLWAQGGVFPPADSHLLHLPFTFALPPSLPPSFHCTRGNSSATISYSIELVGDRPGLFKRNRRVGVLFPIVPAASLAQMSARAQLAEPWTGLSRSHVEQSQIRKYPWGGYGAAEAELITPKLPSFPIRTPLPFHLRVTTHTKPLERDGHPLPDGEGEKALFPAPPAGPSGIEFRLDRDLRVVAQGRRSGYTVEAMPALGGMGARASRQTGEVTRVDVAEPEWIPTASDEKSGAAKGVWRRTIGFTGILLFTCPPSFKTTTLSCRYIMHIHVPFPGISNHLRFNVPVVLDSGLEVPPPEFGEAGQSSYGQQVNNRSVDLDLPPAYFTGEDHDWDGDEKS